MGLHWKGSGRFSNAPRARSSDEKGGPRAGAAFFVPPFPIREGRVGSARLLVLAPIAPKASYALHRGDLDY
jgi:hypothetical protein